MLLEKRNDLFLKDSILSTILIVYQLVSDIVFCCNVSDGELRPSLQFAAERFWRRPSHTVGSTAPSEVDGITDRSPRQHFLRQGKMGSRCNICCKKPGLVVPVSKQFRIEQGLPWFEQGLQIRYQLFPTSAFRDSDSRTFSFHCIFFGSTDVHYSSKNTDLIATSRALVRDECNLRV